MLYEYIGLDAGGNQVAGSIDATGQREARSRLRNENIYVTSLAEEKVAGKDKYSLPFLVKHVSPAEMSSFIRQISSLLAAGITLLEALTAAQNQCEADHFKKIITTVKNQVREGNTLADALVAASDDFDGLTIAMVRAGETGGNLAEVLNQIADLKETSLKRDNAIKSAMIYPFIMAFIGVAVIVFLLAYVVPKIVVIFEDSGHALPLSTRILIFVTDLLANYGILLGFLLLAAIIGGGKYLKTTEGRERFDVVSLKLPLVGPLLRSAILARWSHTTAVLLQSGVPLLRTLKLSGDVSHNTLYSAAIEKAALLIREGGAIAPSLDASGLFPPIAIQMIAAGEKSGQSAKLLMQVARDQGAELENRISVLMSLVQPALIVSLGLIVGFIVIAILLPIFEMSQLLG
ncbi:MAG: type II secretion system F family protein [Nitrospinae bacterium]|nr:type II secretion system F family protein [Nitrospinota bacterium]